VALAAMAIGAAMRSIELAQRFAKGRTVATGLLAENGRIREVLAEAGAGVQAVQTLLSRITTWQDAGEEVADAWFFCAKILGCELGWNAIDAALQILAARGFLDTSAVGQHFRDYRLFRIFEGTTEAVTVYLGTILVRDPDRISKVLSHVRLSPEAVKLVDQVTEICADPPEDAGARHIHAAAAGELACWALLAAVTGEVAHRSAMDGYTAAWAEYQVQLRLRDARLRSHRDLPSLAEFGDHVAGYAEQIGDVGQRRWPGEDWRVDPLLG